MPRQDITTVNIGFFRKNDFKKPDDKTPDFRGDCNINGVQFEIGGWINKGDDGKKYFSLRFQVPHQQQPPPQEAQPAGDFAGF